MSKPKTKYEKPIIILVMIKFLIVLAMTLSWFEWLSEYGLYILLFLAVTIIVLMLVDKERVDS